MNLEEAKKTFSHPPMDVRPAAFWFLNDHLDPKRCIEQFVQMLDAGMGGAVLHAREGLPYAEYLDESWFDTIQAVLQCAKERGATAWLYDELGWPSGVVAGRLPQEYPELRMMHLAMCDLAINKNTTLPENLVAAFLLTQDNSNHGYQHRRDGSISLLPDPVDYTPIPLPVDTKEYEGKRILLFHTYRWEHLPNYFAPEFTKKFLEMTHAQYYTRFPEYFGDTLTHAFMDETGMRGCAASLPWDTGFAEEFKTRRGYDLLMQLPDLFFETAAHQTTRFDYWTLVAEKFREGFAIPMNEWCTEHKLRYSGHYEFEAPLKEAIRQHGALMPLYAHQGMIGIDILGNDFYSRRFAMESYLFHIITIKQAASVNHQLSKGGLLCECFGVGGHAMGPEAMHSATQFLLALGVTFFSHHAPFYSIRGNRKLDCPPFIDWREPYWPYIRKYFNEVTRGGWLLSQGRPCVDVLVLHPAASMQASYRLFRCPEEYKAESYLLDADLPFEMVEKHFALLSSQLLDAQIDFDYGDEELMGQHGDVEDRLLRVGDMRYRWVVIPPSTNMRSSTLALLRRFQEAGGELILLGSAPHLLDGRPSTETRQFFQEHAMRIVDGVDLFDYAPLIQELVKRKARTVILETSLDEERSQLKVQRRRWEERDVLYLANIAEDALEGIITFTPALRGSVEKWDLATGETTPVALCESDAPCTLSLSWAPKEAYALVTTPEAHSVHAAPVLETPTVCLTPKWRAKRTSDNMLVLDTCLLQHNSMVETPLWQAREHLRDQRAQSTSPVNFYTRYTFHVSTAYPANTPCKLAIEFPPNASIRLNGRRINTESDQYFLDPAIRRLALPSILPGINTLDISAYYEHEEQLQPPIILGDFQLVTEDNIHFVLGLSPSTLGIGSWPHIGMPFYAGVVRYRTEVELEEAKKVLLNCPHLNGSAEIYVNDNAVAQLLWPPYQCDISHAVQPGKNKIEIHVANTLRNLFGPHYAANEEQMTGFAKDSYFGEFEQPKHFLEDGLLSPPEILIYS